MADFEIENGVLKKYAGPGGDVVVPDGVKSIGERAFEGCRSLASIELPAGLKSLGWGEFYGCSSLVNITIPDSVTSIGNWAFFDCSSLVSITIPDGVTSLGERAFEGCSSLANIKLPAGLTSIGDNAFEDCSSLASITIPDGVTSIGAVAFEDCSSLVNIELPAGLTSIGNWAFYGCSRLMSIELPAGLTSIGISAFAGTPWLATQGKFAIVNGILIKYRGGAGKVVIPDGVTSIGNGAFFGCSSLVNITIPDSVTSIGSGAFDSCRGLSHVSIPAASFKASPFSHCDSFGRGPKFQFTPENWIRTDKKLSKMLLKYADTIDIIAEDAAWLVLYQTAVEWRECVSLALVTGKLSAKEIITAMTEVVNGRAEPLNAANLNSVYAFLQDHITELPSQIVQALTDACNKNSPKHATKLALLSAGSVGEADELEQYVLANSKHPEFFTKALSVASDKIPYADGSRCASKKVIAGLLAEYAYLYEQVSSVASSMVGRNIYYPEELSVNKLAETIAEKLDREALSDYLRGLASGKDYRPWLLSFARFATEDDMRIYCSGLSERPAKERYRRGNALTAMCLSDTRSAMLYLDKAGKLEDYAHFHGTDADTLRDTVLSDIGLNEDGKKTYDLGGTTITVSLQADLTLNLFDEKAGKTVKSIPKKGNDEAQAAAASADYSELKKNIKKVTKNRCDNLFLDFLSGKKKKSGDWQKVYLTNPLLRQIASLLVWEQGGKTFTLSGKDVILADGTAYVMTYSPIKLAHPMEMKQEEVKAWQRYFNSSALKQPFAQIWEPACDLSSISKNRYDGIHIPAYRFSKQEKHGIKFGLSFSDDGAVPYLLYLGDCKLDFDSGTVTNEGLQGKLILGKFEVKKRNRQANHIVSLLDKWTVYGRIIKDDVTVVEQMGNANIAQIMEYIRVAGENNAVNVTAALMNYKNEHFADFDPMDEFVL